MKAVILAGGLGTRLSEETYLKPKPMVEIGDYPILWHIMKIYSAHGVNEFIICCGYKGDQIKKYFTDYLSSRADIEIDLKRNKLAIKKPVNESWLIHLVDTGRETLTGGRLKRVSDYISDGEDFCFTYGDGVGDINVTDLIRFHKEKGKLATLTAVRPSGRFGVLKLTDSDDVESFNEKSEGDGSWINGGFFVLNKKVIARISGDKTTWEREPLESLADDGELAAFRHHGFWQPMDTLYEKNLLNELWNSRAAPWKIW